MNIIYLGKSISMRKLCQEENINYNTLKSAAKRKKKEMIDILKDKGYNIIKKGLHYEWNGGNQGAKERKENRDKVYIRETDKEIGKGERMGNLYWKIAGELIERGLNGGKCTHLGNIYGKLACLSCLNKEKLGQFTTFGYKTALKWDSPPLFHVKQSTVQKQQHNISYHSLLFVITSKKWYHIYRQNTKISKI